MKEFFGYTEPFRRFVQNETFSPQANEIPNHAASWLPGDDYYTNFHEGDPFIKVPEGYARLPGAGYEALHPELKGLDPEDYPDIHKMAILADVAPYSREYNQVSPSCRTQKPSRGRDEPKTRSLFLSYKVVRIPWLLCRRRTPKTGLAGSLKRRFSILEMPLVFT